MTKASVNFKAVKSASHAVSHASRSVEPTYLLPEGKSLGTICLLDDSGNVASVMEAKMALASRQALRQGDYSPVWEGVINLRRPEQGEDAKAYKLDCSKVISEWCQSYQKMTGHTVLRADIHLDEGHLVDGETLLNAHAHVICDKTNEKGRVLKINAPELRKIQDMTAKVTGLDRGESSLKTGRKHIDHQAYKYLAERGRLETQQVKVKLDREVNLTTHNIREARTAKAEVLDLKNQIAQLKAQYDQDRATLKASGEATQKTYQALKIAHEAAIAALKESTKKVEKMDEYTQKLNADLAQKDAQIAQVLIEKAEVIEALVKSGEKSDALLKTAIGHRDAAAKLTDELVDVKAKFAAMAKNYQEELAKGTPAHLIEPAKTASEQPKTPKPDIPTPDQEKTLLDAFMELYAGVKRVALEVIDGCRLDAACGRVGVFSWPSSQRDKPRLQGLCEVPLDKVMPEVGQVFNKRATPGQEGGGVGR